jgi:hypothetical protein
MKLRSFEDRNLHTYGRGDIKSQKQKHFLLNHCIALFYDVFKLHYIIIEWKNACGR